MLGRLPRRGTIIACAAGVAGSYAYCAAPNHRTQTIFSWGQLVPSAAAHDVAAEEKAPVLVSFWKERGLQLKLVSHGATHAAAVDDKGGLWVWGEASGPTPRKLPCASSLRCLASTRSSLYATTQRGEVLQWSELNVRLSSGEPIEPIKMRGDLSQVTATSIAGGDDHVLVVGSRGEVVGFGDNSRGQLGLGEPSLARADEPKRLPLRASAIAAACGHAHSLLLLSDGSCLSFGDDRNLQLGLRATSVKALREGASSVHSPQPVSLIGGRVTAIAAGGGGVE
ncbi:MAG: hypothetical protein SGPRY_010979, partial [Prymnesium sp.]